MESTSHRARKYFDFYRFILIAKRKKKKTTFLNLGENLSDWQAGTKENYGLHKNSNDTFIG